jgi:mRNA interferase RelE/StbE
MFKYKFHQKAEKELKKLDGSKKILFLKQLKKIVENPYIGEELSNKHNLDLVGLRKMYFNKKKDRIVYQIIDNEILIYILSIGKREDLEVYKNAFDRYKENLDL